MGDRVSPLAGCLCSYSNESRRRKVPWFFLSFHFLLVLVQSVNWLEFSAWRKVRGRDLRSMWVCLDRLARKKKSSLLDLRAQIRLASWERVTGFLRLAYEDARRLINRKQMAYLLRRSYSWLICQGRNEEQCPGRWRPVSEFKKRTPSVRWCVILVVSTWA